MKTQSECDLFTIKELAHWAALSDREIRSDLAMGAIKVKIGDELGFFIPENLDRLRRGYAPHVMSGPYALINTLLIATPSLNVKM